MSITIKNNFVFTTIKINGCTRLVKSNSIDGLFQEISKLIKGAEWWELRKQNLNILKTQ